MKNLILKYQNILLLVFFLTIYTLSVGTDPILGDSLAFSVGASKGFDLGTNATNHFLYVNFLALMHQIFPFVNPHYLFVGVSVIFSIFTLFFIRKFLNLFDISEYNITMTLILFGFTFTFWRVSIITEVYAFYLCFVVLFLYQIFKFIKSKKAIHFYLSSFFLGIMFTIHIQTILVLPFCLYVVYVNFSVLKEKLWLGVLIVLSLFSILFIPVIQGKQNMMAIFTDNAYQDSLLGLEWKTIAKSVVRNAAFLAYNFLFFIYFAVKGFKNTPYKKYLFILAIPFVVFILKHNVSDTYVFHLVPYVLLLILIGKGIQKINNVKLTPLFFVLPAMYLLSYNVLNLTDFGTQINDEKGFKGGTKYLFYPALNDNPKIDEFIIAYENHQFENNSPLEKKDFDRQYQLAIEWKKKKKKKKK